MSEFLKHCQENPKMADLEVKIEELESQRDALAKENERLKAKAEKLEEFVKWVKDFDIMSDPYSRDVSTRANDALSNFSRETKDDNG